MARMAGRVSPAQCPVCRRPPGPDCPHAGLTPRQVRRRERREVEAEWTYWRDESAMLAELAFAAQAEAVDR